MLNVFALTATFAQNESADEGMSWLQTIQSGGVIAYLIIGLSIVAVGLIIMHIVQIRRNALLPPQQLETLDTMLAQGDVGAALQFCMDPGNDSYVTRILAAGLSRFQKSAFGAFEIKNALEEAGEEQSARLYRSTDGLGVIGAIAPLMGLLGTVMGMVGAFESISRSADSSNHEELAANISLALVTTLLGLILAIPCIALYTFFRNRIDSLGAEAAMEIERLALHLESAHGAVAAPTPARQAPPRRPADAPAPRPTPTPTARTEGAGS